MPKDNIISDDKSTREAAMKKVGSDFMGGLSVISASETSSSKLIKSTVVSLSKESKSDTTFFGQKEDVSPKKTKSVTLSSPSKHTFGKQETAKGIVDEVICKAEECCAPCRSAVSSSRSEKSPTNLANKPTSNMQALKEEPVPVETPHTVYKHKEKEVDKSDTRMIKSVVKELELPITFPKTKTHVESSPRFERLLIDTHVSRSSIITPESKRKTMKIIYDSVSHTSQHSDTKFNTSEAPSQEKSAVVASPFNLCWCFGFNPDVPVINLSNNESSQIVFANSQYAVLYDFHEDTMTFMQGHLNTMSYITSTVTGSIIATADSGSGVETSRVIVWDRRPCILQVLDNVHLYGCQQIGLSYNGEFLVTISANEIPLCIKLWEWEKENKNAAASVTVKESLGTVKRLTMHGSSNRKFAVTFERSVIFAHVIWQAVFQEGGPEGRANEIEIIKDCVYDISVCIPSKLGSLTDTTFFEHEEATALSSTSKGYVIVWEERFNNKLKRNYKKYVRLNLDHITNIQTVDNKIVVATASGNVTFYDFGLTVLYFQKLQEPIVSLSFNLTTENNNIKTCDEHSSCANLWRKEPIKLTDATLKNKPFSTRHFVVTTEAGRIAYFNVSCGNPKYLTPPSKVPFTAMDMLPNGKFLCAGTASGQCILFDTELHKAKVSQQIKVAAYLCQAVSFLKYSSSGHVLACAMYTGEIWILDPLLLNPTFEPPLDDCNCCVTQMEFSPDSEYLVVVDVSFCVSAYFLEGKPKLLGQYIAHYEPIVKIIVVDGIETKDIYVFTTSQDRSTCSFKIDVENKSFDFICNQRVEQSAIPMYSINYPYPHTLAGTYLGINDEHKLRLCDFHLPHKDKITIGRMRAMYQAPDFGSPVDYMDTFVISGNFYLFLKTKNHIGIHLLPIDGNPYKALGFRASPTDITCCRIHPNGQYVFTISEFCSGISVWEINIKAVDDFHKSGGEGLEPFLRILGKDKENDIIDFFDLGQFLHQGESPNLVRTLRNYLPICEVANVLQALGCLLTRLDIQEITSELINKDIENLNYNVEYDDFVRLYFNHRSTVGLKVKDFRKAFSDFYDFVYFKTHRPEAVRKISEPIFDSASFISKLEETGEEISREELIADFTILTGGQQLSCLSKDDDDYEIPPTMPKEISFETFVKDILGFYIDDSVFEEESVLENLTTT